MKLPSQIILHLVDLFQNSNIRHYYNFFSQTVNWNRGRIKQYQLQRLKSLISYAQKNVKYYDKLIGKSYSFAEDLKILEDIKLLPILTRENIQQNLEDLISSESRKDKLTRSSSSGTSGIPISYFEDKNSSSAGAAAGYFAYGLSGWKPGDKTLHIWGNPTSVAYWNTAKSKFKRAIKNQINLTSTDFNDPNNLENIFNKIKQNEFECIDGYTTAIYELASYMEKNNLPELDVNNVFTTAENLMEHQKIIIEKKIGPLSDLYGCGEINGIAICPVNSHKYFIIDPHVIVETEESSENYKSILVTDLDNKAMPLIRYKVGDLIDNVFEPGDDELLPFSYFNKIMGRESDIIELPNGKKILPVNIVGGTLFRKIGGITKHKVIWNNKHLIFKFETNNDFNYDKAKQLIEKEFENYHVQIEIDIIGKLLPDKNGKYKYFEKTN